MDISSFYTAAHPRTLMGHSVDLSERFALCVLLFPLQSGCLVKYAGKRLCHLLLQLLIPAHWCFLSPAVIYPLGAGGGERA